MQPINMIMIDYWDKRDSGHLEHVFFITELRVDTVFIIDSFIPSLIPSCYCCFLLQHPGTITPSSLLSLVDFYL